MATLAGAVFDDLNNNGQFDANEAPIPNVTIRLNGVEANGGASVSRTATTGADGRYLFDNLNAGTYDLTETQPAGFNNGVNSAGSPPGTLVPPNSIVNIALGQNDQGAGYNFGETAIQVNGFVFLDANRDGTRNFGETGRGNVQVLLKNSSGATIRTATTANDGSYTFRGVPEGSYTAELGTGATGFGLSTPAAPAVNVTNLGASNINFGLTSATFSGNVYVDINGDGARQAGESGIGAVTVALTGTDANGAAVARTVTTRSDGSFVFDNLLTGNYTIRETQPLSLQDGGDSSSFPGVAINNDEFANIALTQGGQIVSDFNFGETGNGVVAGFVFLDSNLNTSYDPNEPGLAGVTITLRSSTGAERQTTTAADGSYSFSNVAPGSYTVTETQPVGFGAGATNSVTALVPTPEGSNPVGGSFNISFGDAPGSISGSVFVDANNNRIQDTGEPPIPGVALSLAGVDVTGVPVVQTVTTDSNGAYRFTNLRAGVYSVRETQPAGFTDGLDAVGSAGGVLDNDEVRQIGVGAGLSPSGYNFGEIGTSVRGFVFLDRDRDGVRDPGETGLTGFSVMLKDSAGSTVGATTTSADGSYVFNNLAAGAYTIDLTPNPIYGDGTPNTISINLPLTGLTEQNFAKTTGSISGAVFVDANSNGVFDAGETGIGGVSIELRRGTGVSVERVTTGSDGRYLFDELTAGSYQVIETQPSTYNDGPDFAGSVGGTVNNDNIRINNLGAGVDATGYNFTEVSRGLSGVVFRDDDRDNQLDQGEVGIPNALVQVVNANDPTNVIASANTDALGQYLFTNLPAGQYVLRKVASTGRANGSPSSFNITIPDNAAQRFDFAEQASRISGSVYIDFNRNGQRDSGERGIANVTVRLTGTDANGGAVNLSQITDVNGDFTFSNLLSGTYSLREDQPVQFANGQNRVGLVNGVPNGTLSDDQIVSILLNPGDQGSDYQFGELAQSVSGRVFIDSDRDGVFDATEQGLAGVTLTLTDNSNASTPATIVTGADGTYQFANVAPGTYSIVETQPNGFGSSTPNTIAAVVVGATPVVDRNFGETTGSIVGSVFLDANSNGIRDNNERGVAGVTVTLTGKDANNVDVTRTTTTDSSGNYLFDNLLAGLYALNETQPAGLPTGQASAGTAGGTVDGSNTIRDIGLGAAINAVNYGFGERIVTNSSISGFVYRDANRNGVRDANESGIGGVALNLSGLDIDNNAVNLTATTGPDGLYTFANLRQGIYRITEFDPASGFFNGQAAAGTSGGIVDGPNVIRNISLGDAQAATGYNFGEVPNDGSAAGAGGGLLEGFVYLDRNRDGVRQRNERGIKGVPIFLRGTDSQGNQVVRQTLTAPNGMFRFANLLPGSYQIIRAPLPNYFAGAINPGTQGGVILTQRDISGIVLAQNQQGTGHEFGVVSRTGRSPRLKPNQPTNAEPREPQPLPPYIGPAAPRRRPFDPRFRKR